MIFIGTPEGLADVELSNVVVPEVEGMGVGVLKKTTIPR